MIPAGRLHAGRAQARIESLLARGLPVVEVMATGPGEEPHPVLRRLVWKERSSREASTLGTLHSVALEEVVDAAARQILARGHSGPESCQLEGPDGSSLFLQCFRPPPGLLIVGAGHLARPVHELGALLGWTVTVADDRPDFAIPEPFPHAHRVVRIDLRDPFREIPPAERTHVLLVTRGHRYDHECLRHLLLVDRTPTEWIGMIGSRRRVRATFHQLREEGVPRETLARIHAPVGLDLGAETPEEIAVAIAAEWVLGRHGGTGRPLRDMERVAHRFFPDDPDEAAGPAGEET